MTERRGGDVSALVAASCSSPPCARRRPDAQPGGRGLEAVRRVVPAGRDVRAAARGARDRAWTAGSGLGATEIAFGALRTGAIDVYPEYTGTGLLAILGEQPRDRDPRAVFERVAREFAAASACAGSRRSASRTPTPSRCGAETADALRPRTLSDLARAAPELRAGLTPDFIGRADGLPGLERAYGLRFAEVRALLPAVKYQALAAGEVDVIDGYSTDGLIARYDLVVLEDDRGFFPPYEAAALVSARLAARRAGARSRR